MNIIKIELHLRKVFSRTGRYDYETIFTADREYKISKNDDPEILKKELLHGCSLAIKEVLREFEKSYKHI